ncbi:hypothetical protein DMENIID0001_011810 [Sergentomyia squamirostris]
MYKLKPVVTDFDVDKPTNMYTIKEINPREDQFLTKLENSLKVDKDGDLGDLEEKQHLLLDKLKDLKRQLVSLQEGLPLCRKPAQPSSRAEFPRDLVIFVDPAAIPYSLLLILKQQRIPLSLSVTFHTHSTVTTLPEDAVKFTEDISALNYVDGVPVSVIWRKGKTSNFEVFLDPTTSFWGEDNFIRYLTRLGVLERSAEVDDLLLDLSHQLSTLNDDKKEQTKLLDRLLGGLKKQKPCQSVDFTTYSALLNFRNNTKIGKVDPVLREIEARL